MIKANRLLFDLMIIFLINLFIIICVVNIFNVRIGLNELTLPAMIFGLLSGFASKLCYAEDIKENLFYADSFIGRFKHLRQILVFIFAVIIISIITRNAEAIILPLIIYFFNTIFVIVWLLFYEIKNGAVFITKREE